MLHKLNQHLIYYNLWITYIQYKCYTQSAGIIQAIPMDLNKLRVRNCLISEKVSNFSKPCVIYLNHVCYTSEWCYVKTTVKFPI